MNDLDRIESEINSLTELVKSLIEKQGLVISHYKADTVLTPEEEAVAKDEWEKHVEKTTKWLSDLNKRNKNN